MLLDMKIIQRGFIIPLLLIIFAILLAGGGTYLYVQNKQIKQSDTATQSTQATSTAQTKKDSILVQSVQGNIATLRVLGNSEQSCSRHEYKIDFGDGKNEYLDIPEGTCTKMETIFTHTYQTNGTFNARLHNLTGIDYYEPAFDQVENSVSTTTVQVMR